MMLVRGLVKRFGELLAVAGLDLEVHPGEVVGFLGPNGAGKTTTMQMIAGLLRPSAGSISIAGHDLATEPLAAKAVTAYIPDRPILYDKLTALELLYFVGGLYSMPREETALVANDLLARFGLAGREHALVESFSHGMKQRLAFAAALLHRPKLLVVDEPMVGLDPRGARLITDSLTELASEEGMAVLLSTHTLAVAEELCHRIAILHHGRIVALGTMGDLRREADRPESRLEEVFLRLTQEGS